ncbi:hypothetical protein ANN_24039 [Periplaneta americana]|uniref:Uncharacterized protein n=1 Tax=Periplaneta americana TaxID=6978 RepID=A0ABQ8S2N4_PERAM|nr:hypothetical protein ANN_24039 [Periplaneta americana]
MKITDRGRQLIPTGGTGLGARQTSHRNPGRGGAYKEWQFPAPDWPIRQPIPFQLRQPNIYITFDFLFGHHFPEDGCRDSSRKLGAFQNPNSADIPRKHISKPMPRKPQIIHISLINFGQHAFNYKFAIGLFEHIEQCFLLSGHSFLQCDSDFALIEKQQKVTKAFIPSDLLKIVQDSKVVKPFQTVSMLESYFLNMQDVADQLISIKNLNISKACCIQYDVSKAALESERITAAVAAFRLLTNHDCLASHLYRIGISASPMCVLCNDPAEMNEDHLQTCEALRSEETTVQKYWKAQLLMASLPVARH